MPLRVLFLASTAAVCRSRLSSHALNAECPIVIRRLEDHLVRPVGATEAEAGTEVVGEVSLLLDGGQESLVDGLLVLDAVLGGLLLLWLLSVLSHCTSIVCTYLGLLALLEESILTRLVGGLVLGEVAVLAALLHNLLVYAAQVDAGRGSDDISGVYAAKGNTVDFEGTGNKEDTLGKVLEDDDALAAEATSKEDDDGTGLERLADLRRADRLAGLESQLAELQLMS